MLQQFVSPSANAATAAVGQAERSTAASTAMPPPQSRRGYRWLLPWTMRRSAREVGLLIGACSAAIGHIDLCSDQGVKG
jgi:hypothetical protein